MPAERRFCNGSRRGRRWTTLCRCSAAESDRVLGSATIPGVARPGVVSAPESRGRGPCRSSAAPFPTSRSPTCRSPISCSAAPASWATSRRSSTGPAAGRSPTASSPTASARSPRASPRGASARATSSPSTPERARVRGRVPRRGALGGVTTTINPLYTADELAAQLHDCRRASAVTVPALLDEGDARRRSGRASRRSSSSARPRARRRSPRCSRRGGEPPEVAIDPAEDVVALPVLERHHRPAQGRDAHPPQPGRQPLPDARPDRAARATDDRGDRACCRSSTSTGSS